MSTLGEYRALNLYVKPDGRLSGPVPGKQLPSGDPYVITGGMEKPNVVAVRAAWIRCKHDIMDGP